MESSAKNVENRGNRSMSPWNEVRKSFSSSIHLNVNDKLLAVSEASEVSSFNSFGYSDSPPTQSCVIFDFNDMMCYFHSNSEIEQARIYPSIIIILIVITYVSLEINTNEHTKYHFIHSLSNMQINYLISKYYINVLSTFLRLSLSLPLSAHYILRWY